VSDGASSPRRLDGFQPIQRWLDRHDPEEWPKVEVALMAIQDGTWGAKYRHVDDVTNPLAVVMYIEPELVIVWRVLKEYPNWFRVIYVGHPDDTTFS
jgi:hypothetical protein